MDIQIIQVRLHKGQRPYTMLTFHFTAVQTSGILNYSNVNIKSHCWGKDNRSYVQEWETPSNGIIY